VGDFELDTAVEPTGEDSFRAVLDPSWRIWGPAGGYVSALAMRAAGAATTLSKPVSYACQFLSFAESSEVELRVTRLRTGRRSEALRVEMSQGERAIMEAHIWAADPGEGLEHNFMRAPEAPPADRLRSREELSGRQDTGIFTNLEMRPLDPRPMSRREPGEPVIQGWYRFRPRARSQDAFADAARALVLIDLWTWPAIYNAHPADDPSPWIAPNLDLYVRFHADAREHDWLLSEGRADLATGGLIGANGTVWTPAGDLVASGSSQLFCRPRPAQFR
jgi:acyl-CoA thioesterase